MEETAPRSRGALELPCKVFLILILCNFHYTLEYWYFLLKAKATAGQNVSASTVGCLLGEPIITLLFLSVKEACLQGAHVNPGGPSQ